MQFNPNLYLKYNIAATTLSSVRLNPNEFARKTFRRKVVVMRRTYRNTREILILNSV